MKKNFVKGEQWRQMVRDYADAWEKDLTPGEIRDTTAEDLARWIEDHGEGAENPAYDLVDREEFCDIVLKTIYEDFV